MKNLTAAILAIIVFIFSQHTSYAQRFSVSSNAVDWAALATINAEGGVAVSRHISVHGGVRINPWVFRFGDPEVRFENPDGDDEKQFQYKKQAYNVGIRYWPWYIYSGFWFGARGQYMEYDRGGVFVHEREAGDAVGLGLSAGYTYMLHEHWNLDFGVGAWGGWKWYGTYRCTNCGRQIESGQKAFILPDFVSLSVMYIF